MTIVAGRVVRASTPADVPAIAAIYGHYVVHGLASFEREPPAVAEMAARRQALLDGGYPQLVAVDDAGVVVGFAQAGVYRPRAAYRHTVENTVYVAPTAARRGVGRTLLAALIEDCAARGFRQMIAVVGDSANSASIEFHESLGFRGVGTLRAVGYKFDRWVDSVILQRPLGEGDRTPPGKIG